jgi:hypothetical protein
LHPQRAGIGCKRATLANMILQRQTPSSGFFVLHNLPQPQELILGDTRGDSTYATQTCKASSICSTVSVFNFVLFSGCYVDVIKNFIPFSRENKSCICFYVSFLPMHRRPRKYQLQLHVEVWITLKFPYHTLFSNLKTKSCNINYLNFEFQNWVKSFRRRESAGVDH